LRLKGNAVAVLRFDMGDVGRNTRGSLGLVQVRVAR
jgi:hypothetical protein